MEWFAKLDISASRGIMAAHRQPAYSDWDGQLPVTNHRTDSIEQARVIDAPHAAGQQ